MAKKFMYVNRKAPFGTIYALESLEVVLIGAAFEQIVSLATELGPKIISGIGKGIGMIGKGLMAVISFVGEVVVAGISFIGTILIEIVAASDVHTPSVTLNVKLSDPLELLFGV